MITVVTGLPRSGTSLAMQLLEAAGIPPFTDGQRKADASNPQGYYEAEIVKTLPQDNAWLEEAEGHALKVIHLLLPHLPDNRQYRVLLMERDPAAVVRSQRRMLERLGRVGGDLAETRLVAVLAAQLQAAQRWLALLPPQAVLRLGFEACLAEPQQQAAMLLAWLQKTHDRRHCQRLAQLVQR